MSRMQSVVGHGMMSYFPFDVFRIVVAEPGFVANTKAAKPGKGGWDD